MFFPTIRKGNEEHIVGEDADILSPSPFFARNKDTIIWIRDSAIIALYLLLIVVIFMSTWIKAQSAAFPFNVNVVAKSIYFGDAMARPLLVFICVFIAFLFAMALRMIFMGVLENSIGSRIETHMQTHGHIRKLKIK